MGKNKTAPSKSSGKVKDKIRSGSHSLNPGKFLIGRKFRKSTLKLTKNLRLDRVEGKGGNNMRSKATIDRLRMYKNFKAVRNSSGKVIKPAPFQSWVASGTQARVEPNRKWFGNTRVIGQNALQTFQEEMGKAASDPYKMILKPTNLPTTILNEKAKVILSSFNIKIVDCFFFLKFILVHAE